MASVVSEAKEGDKIKIAGYARWLTVSIINEDGSVLAVHGFSQFELPPDHPVLKLKDN